jgi:preprotein translocase SecF subunit
MIDLVSKRFLFVMISLLIIVPGLIAVALGGLKPGIDFRGGTRWEVKPASEQANSTEAFRSALASAGFGDAQVKSAVIGVEPNITNTIIMDLPGQVQGEDKVKIEEALVNSDLVLGVLVTETVALTPTTGITPSATITGTGSVTGTTTVTATEVTTGTTGSTGGPTETRVVSRIQPSEEIDFRSVGPTVGSELLGRAVYAIAAASLVILIYLTLVFRRVPNAFRYGVCAIIALLHDVLVVLGIFAMLGLLFGVEIDALFVTAMLTVIGFSVHDTIVVFDRVRENIGKRRFERLDDVVNYSVVQTLARSINTSVTVVLTLFALYMFGGGSIHNFVLALLIGIISGTYSSIFNASMLLVIWENREWSRLFGRGGESTRPARSATAR